jgi:hypothetical protein
VAAALEEWVDLVAAEGQAAADLEEGRQQSAEVGEGLDRVLPENG